MAPPSEDPGVTVVVRRRIKADHETAFENAMRGFIPFALSFPGGQGIQVAPPAEAEAREYTVVHRFASAEARRAFTASRGYAEWMTRLREVSAEDPRILELGGPGGWFPPPDPPSSHRPPVWKMAAVTFLGVYPLTSVLPRFIGGLLPGWHPLLVNVPVTSLVVALLSWVVMPALTRVFRPWLFPHS